LRRSDVTTSTVLHSIAFEGLTQVDSMKENFNGIRHVLGVSKVHSKGTKILLPKYLADRETPSGPVNVTCIQSGVSSRHYTGSLLKQFHPSQPELRLFVRSPSIYTLYSASQQI